MRKPQTFINKGAATWITIVVAFMAAILGAAVLSLIYHKISEDRFVNIEKRMEEKEARDVVEKFIEARIGKNESQANIYLTEGAMEQKIKGDFVLIDDFKSFDIEKIEELEGNKLRFTAILYKENLNFILEIIITTKISEKYYIDSINIAG